MNFLKNLFRRRSPEVRATPEGPKRTRWKIVCYDCSYKRPGAEPDCEACRHEQLMFPLSRYQATGGGTGFYPDPEGHLISSLCQGEWAPSDADSNRPSGKWHAPLFDFDYPAEWIPSGESGGTLLLKRPVVAKRLLPVLKALQRRFLIRSGAAFLAEYEFASAPHDRPEGVDGYRAQAEYVIPDVRIELTAPGAMLPSRTDGHHHFYLERKVAWDDYLALMRAMADADLLEKEWVAMNERRRMAFLRRPSVPAPVPNIPHDASH